jgi:hypothetical protein
VLEELLLPKTVYGGHGYELHRVSDAPDLLRAVYHLKKQRPSLNMGYWFAVLSVDSPDWYESADEDDGIPPFFVGFVEAGSRVGYRWESFNGDNQCEVNWLDPEPTPESRDYDKYIEELQEIEDQVTIYRGFREPPTEEEYLGLWGE